MVLVQDWPFFELFFLFNIGLENDFYDILERKNAFLGYKTTSLECRKIEVFAKGLTHGLVKIWPFFQPFFKGNIG